MFFCPLCDHNIAVQSDNILDRRILFAELCHFIITGHGGRQSVNGPWCVGIEESVWWLDTDHGRKGRLEGDHGP